MTWTKTTATKFITIEDLQALEPYRATIVDLYGRAFAEAPYLVGPEDVERFAELLPRHAKLPGFRMVIAVQFGIPVGFTYGHTNEPGQWWWEQVAPGLSDAQRAEWFEGAFAVVELGVAPEARRQGIARRLLRRLLAGLPHHTAVLSTIQAETPAMTLYRRLGWETILPAFRFSVSPVPWAILGLRLDSDTTTGAPSTGT